MLWKVGELARRCGLTVRTLHHYDEIGLVRPSARSAAGYRLYDEQDVARLHAVQALRQLGFGLARIGEMLQAGTLPARQLVAEQLRAVEEDIERARALRAQLRVLQQALDADAPPDASQWLTALSLMAAWQRHFSVRELEPMLRRWRRTRTAWQPMLDEVRAAMHAGHALESPAVQALAQRWMDQAMSVTGGDLPLALRWARMNEQAPATARHQGLDPRALGFLGRAIELRLAALRRHLSEEDLRRMDTGLATQWQAMAERACAAMAQPPPDGGGAGQEGLASVSRCDAHLAAGSRHWRRPMLCAGAGRVARRSHDRRRPAGRHVAPGCHRVFLPPGNAAAARGCRL